MKKSPIQSLFGIWFFVLSVDICVGVTTDGFYLKKSPTSREVEEGSRMSYECLAVPSDHIIYKWSHNDRPIVLDQHRYIGNDNRTLIFDHADRDIDPGSYNCLAQNSSSKFARKSKQGQLDVTWLDPDVNIKLLQPLSLSELKIGGSLLLKCDASASPKLTRDTIHWYFNGNGELPAGIRIQSDGSLIIESIELTHNGFFHCFIYHKAGKLDALTPFIIAINDRTLHPTEFSKYAKEGSKVQLNCPWSNSIVVWSRIVRLGDPLTLISPESTPNILVKDSNLTILAMDSTTDAYYVCQIVGKPNTKTAIFRVSLTKMYNFKKSQFTPPLDQKERLIIRQGENGSIRFYIDLTPTSSFIFDKIPNPAPSITWEYNNVEIPKWNQNSNKPAPRIHVLRSRHLIIQNASVTDRGTYTIKMRNEAGEQRRPFKVLVTYPPLFEDSSQDQTLQVNEDDSLTLDCKIRKMSEEGTTKVYWKRNGSPIALYMESISLENNGKNLRIDKAKSEHSGMYQCFVKTLGFPEFYNMPQTITVKAKLQFTGLLDEVFLEVNRNGSVHCKTKGYGQIRTFWYDITGQGTVHSKLNLVPIHHPHDILNNGTLILRNVQKEYSGDYLCEARSLLTKEVINKTIKVKVGEKPKIVFVTTNKTVQEGSTLLLDCTASGEPTPTISWFMDNALSQKQLITFDGNKKTYDRKKVMKNGTLLIRSTILSDEGKYTCYATNNQFVAAEESVIVKVLTPEEYSKMKHSNDFNRGMLKTIVIVVSCALAYLALIIGLTAFCSVRMLRNRRNRSLTEKLGDNSQLMKPLGSSNPNGGYNSSDKMTIKSSRSQPNNSATNNYLPQVPALSSHGYYTQYSAVPIPSYMANPMLDTHGSEFQHLMSAPPPTPLESRSNLSGNLSSTNSASQYTRSQPSSSTNGGVTGIGMNSMERFTYPRHELQTEGILGKGEFGDVFLARARNILDGESQSLVIVKSLVNNESSHCHEFHRQLDMLARLDSNFVTKLLGICIEMEPCLLIFEYCEWGDLKQFLQCMKDHSNPNMPLLSRIQKLNICAQIATGMDHVASIRCVHKDLAARNVLITPQLNVKISHLGLCRDTHQGDYHYDGKQFLPIRWMPPESVLRNEFSLNSDVWSFAVTCWEIFALGSLPMSNYQNEEIIETLSTSASSLHCNKVQTMYASLEQFPGDCPSSLVSVVRRCLFIDLQSRPNFTEISKCMKDVESMK